MTWADSLLKLIPRGLFRRGVRPRRSVRLRNLSFDVLEPRSMLDVRTIMVDSIRGDDANGDGQFAESAYRTVDRALRDVPTLIDQGYVIQLAAGTYTGQIDLDRFAMPAGLLRTTWRDGVLPAAYLMIRGDRADPASVVIECGQHCINASGVLLFVQGITGQGAGDAALFAAASSVVVDDVVFADSRGGIHLDASQASLGGTIRVTGSVGIPLSIRQNSLVRDTTPFNATVRLVIDGGAPAGVFLRDHSAMALQQSGSVVEVANIRGTGSGVDGFGVYAQQHAHLFGTSGTRVEVRGTHTGLFALHQSYINVDAAASSVRLLTRALRDSYVDVERLVARNNVAQLAQVDFNSSALVGGQRFRGTSGV